MATVYISNTGDDTTGAGTSVSPWKTISKAFTSSASGDTIHCLSAGGTFTWANQSFTTDRTIVGDAASTTIFDGGAAAIDWRAVGSVVDISQITFQNAVVNGSFGSIFLGDTGGGFFWTDCIFTVLVGTGLNGIIGNQFASTNSSYGLTACLLYNLTASSAVACPIFVGGTGALDTISIKVYNCTFYSNSADAATLRWSEDQTSSNIVFDMKNNIIWNANGTNKAWYGTGSSLTTYSAGTANNDILGYSSVPSLTGTISSDPLFVDVANNNFNLRPTSPCIDAGVII